MKVFISWSKPISHQIALILRDWLPEVMQAIDPWLSSEDISKGQRWASEIGTRLSELNHGIICVTSENVGQPWLNFEAGALAKSLDSARVRPLLYDLRPSDLTGPLSLFQATVLTDKMDMLKLIASLNEASTVPLETQRLQRSFERSWLEFASRIETVKPTTALSVPSESEVHRSADDMIAELLSRVRDLQRTLSQPSFDSDWPELAPSWPRDGENELKVGENVTLRGNHGVIVRMTRRGESWGAVVRMSEEGKLVLVSDVSKLRWVPF